ncbi:MAG: DNRLRE domain-containing protein [Phycisphaerales bacterium JB058]
MATSICISGAAAGQQEMVFTPVQDTSIYSDNPDGMYGSETTCVIGEFDTPDDSSNALWWSLFQWDFVGPNKVPEESEILSVELEFRQGCLSSTSDVLMRFADPNKMWTESSEWNDIFIPTNITSQYAVLDCTGSSRWISFEDDPDIISWVQDIVDGDRPNYGLMLRPDPAQNQRYQVFNTRESSSPPRMKVTFKSVPTAPDCAVVDVAVADGTYLIGDHVDVDVTVQNNGGSCDSIEINCFFDRNSSTADGMGYSSSCTGISPVSCDLDGLESGESRTLTLTVPIHPAIPRQDYYVLAVVGCSDDQDTGNNFGYSGNQISLETSPNFSVDQVAGPVGRMTTCDSFDFSGVVENVGGFDSETFIYQFVLSPARSASHPDAVVVYESEPQNGIGARSSRAISNSISLMGMGIEREIDLYTGLVVISTDYDQANNSRFSEDSYVVPFCLQDVNGDGCSAPSDFSAWVGAYHQGDLSADQNGDGLVTPADFSAWVTNYNGGCE